MRILVRLHDTRTGETKDIEETISDDERNPDYTIEDFLEFYYTEGNMGCDCNRSLIFYNYDRAQELECFPGGVIELLELGYYQDDGTYVPVVVKP